MKELLYHLSNTSYTTYIFIFCSIFFLAAGQYILLINRKYYFIPFVHIFFGYILSLLSVYNFLVQIYLYLIPSFIVTFIISLFVKTQKVTKLPDNEFLLKFETINGELKFIPFSGVCILGTPKAGKTASIVKPTIEQLAKKNWCGIIYDYKKFDLTKCAFYHYQNHKKVSFRSINFFDLNYTYRINPISSKIIKHPAYAYEASYVFLANMMGSVKTNSNDRYWVDSAAGLMAGIIWRLAEEFPKFCDIPHVISIIAKSKIKELTKFLEQNDQSVLLASSYFKSVESENQVAGILGTLASSLSKVSLPEIFYVLSGDEVNLDLNNPDNPTMLTLSTMQALDKSYSPALALIISIALKLMNTEDKHHSAIILDEAPTIIVPEFDRIPATARSNKIATFFVAQDMVQAEDGYGRIGRDKILATLSTHIYGKVTDPETAERYSKMFGTIDKYYTSTSRKAGAMLNSGYTDSIREVRKYKPELFTDLETGQFLGVIAEGNVKKFNGKFKCYEDIPIQLPMIRNISTNEVKQVFNTIIEESISLLR